MDVNKLKRRAENLVRKNAPKLERGVSSAERFAAKKAKGREGQVHQAANAVRGVIGKAGKTQPPR